MAELTNWSGEANSGSSERGLVEPQSSAMIITDEDGASMSPKVNRKVQVQQTYDAYKRGIIGKSTSSLEKAPFKQAESKVMAAATAKTATSKTWSAYTLITQQ
ncbi:unnamed protein product [Rhizophagus irregularis]|nr:unnamed protein product [Rhizophagus irregularis]